MAFDVAHAGASNYCPSGHSCASHPPLRSGLFLITGKALSAARKTASAIATKALMPARSRSLFLTGTASLPARCFSSPSTLCSAFGMVKLSRISFAFFSFTDLPAFGFALALTAGLIGALTTGLGGLTLIAGLAGALTTAFRGKVLVLGADGFATFLVNTLAATPAAAAAGFATLAGMTSIALTGATVVNAFSVVTMLDFPLVNEEHSLCHSLELTQGLEFVAFQLPLFQPKSKEKVHGVFCHASTSSRNRWADWG